MALTDPDTGVFVPKQLVSAFELRQLISSDDIFRLIEVENLLGRVLLESEFLPTHEEIPPGLTFQELGGWEAVALPY